MSLSNILAFQCIKGEFHQFIECKTISRNTYFLDRIKIDANITTLYMISSSNVPFRFIL